MCLYNKIREASTFFPGLWISIILIRLVEVKSLPGSSKAQQRTDDACAKNSVL